MRYAQRMRMNVYAAIRAAQKILKRRVCQRERAERVRCVRCMYVWYVYSATSIAKMRRTVVCIISLKTMYI
jgi:hypothetical protein